MLFQNYISLLPEFILALCIIVMLLVNRFREAKTPKTFFTLSKIFLFFALLFTLVFYNRSAFPQYLENNPYTTLFKVIVYVLAIAWFYLSCKWFLNKSRSSLGFYISGIVSVLCLGVAVSAENLLVLYGALEISFLLNFFLIRLSDEEEAPAVANRYLAFALLFAALSAAGLYLLYLDAGSLGYSEVDAYLSSVHKITFRHYLAVSLFLGGLLFMMGIAPLHFWFVDAVGIAILPVSGFLTLIPVFAYFSCLADLIVNVFFSVYGQFKPVLISFAVLSVVIGAVGANSEGNLRRLFAFSTVYHLGVMLVCLAAFNDNSLLSSFVYLATYILAMSGMYTVFYGFKSKGEYLVNLESLSGISEVKPYISAASLLFMVSLIGTPPLMGFLGKLSVMNSLIIQGSYTWILIISFSLLMLAYAYLRVIKVIYFDDRKINFDRADKGVYICLMINIILVLIALLNPKYLMSDVERMLVTIF